jgi:hypothetical protein
MQLRQPQTDQVKAICYDFYHTNSRTRGFRRIFFREREKAEENAYAVTPFFGKPTGYSLDSGRTAKQSNIFTDVRRWDHYAK